MNMNNHSVLMQALVLNAAAAPLALTPIPRPVSGPG